MTVWGDIGGVDSTSRIPGDTHGDPVHVVCPAAQRARKGGGSGSLPSPPPPVVSKKLSGAATAVTCEWPAQHVLRDGLS